MDKCKLDAVDAFGCGSEKIGDDGTG